MKMTVFWKEVKSVFSDYSVPIVVAVMFVVNYFVYMYNNVPEFGEDRFTLWESFMFDTLVIIAYAGFLGNKLFTREIEKKTLPVLLITPIGRRGVYFQKILSGMFIVGVLSLLLFFQPLFTFIQLGTVSYLFIYWSALFTIILFLAGLFSMFLSISTGVLIKKSTYTMLISSVYVIVSFFMLVAVPMVYDLSGRVYLLTVVFPFISNRYVFLAISAVGIAPVSMILLPFLGVLWMWIMSYLLYMGVRL